MPRNEYGCVHHFISPLWARTTWNSWMRSRFSASATSMRSASPRVPTSEKLWSRWSAAKSSQAARNSRLWAARSSAPRRLQAGSTFRNVYLTKCRPATPSSIRTGSCPGRGRRYHGAVRIALVSPYSWTYPGGVTRHIEALAEELLDFGHEVRVLAPYDPPDARSARLHRGARPAARDQPDYLVSLGRTIGLPANGAVSNVSVFPEGIFRLRTELARGRFDVVHLQEPVGPTLCWDALTYARGVPLVGTFHTYSTNHTQTVARWIGAGRRMNRLAVRVAVSDVAPPPARPLSAAAAGPPRLFYGVRYRVIPSGVHVPEHVAAELAADGPLKIVFVGQA